MRRAVGAVALVAGLLCTAAGAQAPGVGAGANSGGLLPPTPGGTTGSVVPSGAAAAAGGAAAPAPGQVAAPIAQGPRFVEGCQQGIERGQVPAGCQGPLYANEIARLKEEALRTNNASLLTLLGDAYRSNRSAISDVGQAYRWYLLAAVRGDPRAMQRLTELYQAGNGAPQDRVKALGYARLAQRLALPGTKTAADAAAAATSLGNEMAAEEVTLADRFAGELEAGLRRQGVPLPTADAASANASANAAAQAVPGGSGMTTQAGSRSPQPGPAIPGMTGMSPPTTSVPATPAR